MKKSYLTTPLYYVNARPHLGHAYTTILGDVIKRHRRQRGAQVTLLTGTDEHGDKIDRMAKEVGKAPQEFADEVAGDFKATWEKMNLDFDIFYRTTDASHVKAVQHALQTLKDREEIVFHEYEGNYCVGCERFLTDTEITPEGNCPDHQRPPEKRREANYFFKMSKYQQHLIDYYEKDPNTIRPDHYRREILSFLKQPLEDLCISRPKDRLSWGIELPFDSKFVTYVWFDALLNYLVATGWPEKHDKELWESVNHLIAKDIVKAHAIYWTAMLFALGVKPFKELHTHGYWLMGQSKMSKSLGNVVRPIEVEATYGQETLRFYLLREMSFGLDSSFTLEAYVNSVNANLANGIGNLVSRVMTLCQKNFKGTLPESGLNDADRAMLAKRETTLKAWDEGFSELKYQNSLKAWSELVTAVDLYVNDNKPWALAKAPAQSDRLQVVLGTCLRVIQALGVMVYPVLPQASLKICSALGLGEFDLKSNFPPLSLALENRTEFKLVGDVPKLFARVALPVEEGAEAAPAKGQGKGQGQGQKKT